MKSDAVIASLPAGLKRSLARRAAANHRTVEGEILHRLEQSVALDRQETELAAHLKRSLSGRRHDMHPDDVLQWAQETFNRLESPAGQK
jgi:plasmid stability protein